LTRYVIYGAGAVGGAIGGALCRQGFDVALIARGDHGREMAAHGMRMRTPAGDFAVRPAVVAAPHELTFHPGDVVILAMKSQDTAAALGALVPVAPGDLCVVCAQNGVDNEREAARFFTGVVAMCVNVPGVHLVPGEIRVHSAPGLGMLHVGRYPSGSSATVERLAADLRAAGFDAEADAAVMRRKYAKLLINLGNAFEAACGRAGRADELSAPLRREALACYAAAGIEALSLEEAERRSFTMAEIDGTPYDGCSSWQSLARGSGAIEADYLNGEIARLGRLHGVPTPMNELAQRLANHLAATNAAPGSLSVQDVLDQVNAAVARRAGRPAGPG
jgi:2-dehydropantoate 2-reductase